MFSPKSDVFIFFSNSLVITAPFAFTRNHLPSDRNSINDLWRVLPIPSQKRCFHPKKMFFDKNFLWLAHLPSTQKTDSEKKIRRKQNCVTSFPAKTKMSKKQQKPCFSNKKQSFGGTIFGQS